MCTVLYVLLFLFILFLVVWYFSTGQTPIAKNIEEVRKPTLRELRQNDPNWNKGEPIVTGFNIDVTENKKDKNILKNLFKKRQLTIDVSKLKDGDKNTTVFTVPAFSSASTIVPSFSVNFGTNYYNIGDINLSGSNAINKSNIRIVAFRDNDILKVCNDAEIITNTSDNKNLTISIRETKVSRIVLYNFSTNPINVSELIINNVFGDNVDKPYTVGEYESNTISLTSDDDVYFNSSTNTVVYKIPGNETKRLLSIVGSATPIDLLKLNDLIFYSSDGNWILDCDNKILFQKNTTTFTYLAQFSPENNKANPILINTNGTSTFLQNYSATTKNSTTFSFTKNMFTPSRFDSSLHDYTVTVKDKSDTVLKTYKSTVDTTKFILNSNTVTVILNESLQPFSSYDVTIQCKNYYKDSKPLTYKVYTSTERANSTLSDYNETSVKINMSNIDVKKYKIVSTRIRSNGTIDPVVNYFTTSTQYTLPIDNSSVYSIVIYGVGEVDDILSEGETRSITNPDVPRNIIFSSITHNSLVVKFDSPSTILYNITGYDIEYDYLNKDGTRSQPASTARITLPTPSNLPSSNQLDITGLISNGTPYQFRIRTRSYGRISNFATSSTVNTLTSPVINAVYNPNTQSLSWNYITNVYNSLTNFEVSTNNGATYTVVPSYLSSGYKIDLRPSVQYNCKIIAVSGTSRSTAVDVGFVTPPVILKSVFTDDDNILNFVIDRDTTKTLSGTGTIFYNNISIPVDSISGNTFKCVLNDCGVYINRSINNFQIRVPDISNPNTVYTSILDTTMGYTGLVTSGLTLLLDSNNPDSYPAPYSTRWFDLSPKRLTFNMVAPNLDAVNSLSNIQNEKAINFNGRGYFECSSGSNLVNLEGDCTVIMCLYEPPSTSNRTSRKTIFEKVGTTFESFRQELAVTWEPSRTITFYTGNTDDNKFLESNTKEASTDAGSWTMMAIKLSALNNRIRRTFYSKNGAPWVENPNTTAISISPAGNIRIGAGYVGQTSSGPGVLDNASISFVACYDRMLTDAEILQNYTYWKNSISVYYPNVARDEDNVLTLTDTFAGNGGAPTRYSPYKAVSSLYNASYSNSYITWLNNDNLAHTNTITAGNNFKLFLKRVCFCDSIKFYTRDDINSRMVNSVKVELYRGRVIVDTYGVGGKAFTIGGTNSVYAIRNLPGLEIDRIFITQTTGNYLHISQIEVFGIRGSLVFTDELSLELGLPTKLDLDITFTDTSYSTIRVFGRKTSRVNQTTNAAFRITATDTSSKFTSVPTTLYTETTNNLYGSTLIGNFSQVAENTSTTFSGITNLATNPFTRLYIFPYVQINESLVGKPIIRAWCNKPVNRIAFNQQTTYPQNAWEGNANHFWLTIFPTTNNVIANNTFTPATYIKLFEKIYNFNGTKRVYCKLRFLCDDNMIIYVNDCAIASHNTWQITGTAYCYLNPGENRIQIEQYDNGGASGFILSCTDVLTNTVLFFSGDDITSPQINRNAWRVN